MASLKRIGGNVAAQGLALAASLVDRVVLVGLMLRAWGPDLFADYAVLQSWATLLAVGDFGVQIYFQNVERSALARGDRAAFRRFAAIHLWLLVVFCGALALVGLASLPFATALARNAPLDTAETVLVLVLIGAGSLSAVVRSAVTTRSIALGDFARITLIGAVGQLALTVTSSAAVLLGAGPVVLAALFFLLFGVVIQVLTARDCSVRHPGTAVRPARPTRAELADLGSHLGWLGAVSLAPTVLLLLPVVLFGLFGLSGAAIAGFLLLRTLVNLLRQFFQFAALGAGLEISTHAHGGDFARAWRLSAAIGRWISVVGAVASVGLLCFGREVVTLWSGSPALYDPAVAAWLALAVVATGPFQQILALLQFTNQSRIPGQLRLVQMVAAAAMVPVGLAASGVAGAAAALTLAEIFACVVALPALARSRRFPGLATELGGAGALSLAAAVWAGAVGWALEQATAPTSLAGSLAVGAAWAALGALPPVIAALPPTLRDRAAAVWRGRPEA
ncbi:hypothetical protein [Oharaeibacter diazotrophicus]|uniref:O-antigen/teichoic acid export membrane protein n=2 Tax=Oharaeibacter diazotrophicus TaxID=1920512 RepID=A0A4R6R908_9HYPH|nr:hypothetical protein [Oharaeibacter diazotrophicus]TDP82305.1 O-antigen/teichoic acid export membrane protein [Oharaeibacter diazotrophicus]BBE72932.1 hypothetical protein OHA_1_02531 [Pleomorphomonas sp. SM30]GLS76970.1 hypothetical protein GCM10007904_23070 [Oharaeibacter diazotrophicus]